MLLVYGGKQHKLLLLLRVLQGLQHSLFQSSLLTWLELPLDSLNQLLQVTTLSMQTLPTSVLPRLLHVHNPANQHHHHP